MKSPVSVWNRKFGSGNQQTERGSFNDGFFFLRRQGGNLRPLGLGGLPEKFLHTEEGLAVPAKVRIFGLLHDLKGTADIVGLGVDDPLLQIGVADIRVGVVDGIEFLDGVGHGGGSLPFFFYDKHEDQRVGYFRVVRISAGDFVKMTTETLAAEFATLYKDFETTGKLDVQSFTVYIGGGVALELSDDNFCAD